MAAVQTNIVVLNTGAVPAAQVAAAAKDQGVWVSALGPRMLRAVTHLDVAVEDARTAGEVVGASPLTLITTLHRVATPRSNHNV